MPRLAERPCRQPGCPVLTDSGYCSKHALAYEQRRGSPAKRGYDHRWQKLRLAILNVEPLCRACRAAGRVEAATDVDHVLPKRQGGTDAPGNLQPLCHACHSAKTAREDGRWGRPAKAPGGLPSAKG